MKRILTIAGSDSGGGAGIQADLKTITLLGGFGMSVLTALTAQNTKEVRAIHAPPADFVTAQLDAVLSDLGADAVKTGMLYDASIIEAVVRGLQAHRVEKVVVDPVMVAKGGDRLLVEQAVKALKEKLIPLAYVLTPNIPEAEILADKKIATQEDLRSVARTLHTMGARYVLMKGGHLTGPAVDTLFDGTGFETFSRQRVDTPHTHGTGCVYSAAIATFLGFGLDVRLAVDKAKSFIHSAIRFGVALGKGRGPTNLFAPFAREQARYCVLEELKTCAQRLHEPRLGRLVPEVQANLGYALPFAETCEDVAAFPGRLVRLHDKITSVGCPSFGASRHIATIILTMMRHDPTYRSAINIRFSEEILKQCETLGWRVRFFDRRLEPEEIKQREGSSLEWGTETVLAQETAIPDIIFDRGDVGKEPMIRVLGRTPGEVVGKILRL